MSAIRTPPPPAPARPDPPRRAGRTPLAAVLAALLVLVAACRSDDGRRSAMDDVRRPLGQDAPLRIFATGDTRGFLEPCGCEDGQFGGLPRRTTYARRTRRAGDLWIDLGNFTAGDGELRRLRREAILDGLAHLGYDALVPGRAEVADGEAFDAAARARRLRVVCANVVDAEGRPVFEPWVVFPLPDGRRAAVVGITEPADAAPGGRRVLAPADALRRAVAELVDEADVIVAATSLPEDAARALAAQVPGPALVLSGSTPDPDVPFTGAGGAVVGVAGHLGEYVARVDFGPALRPAVTWRAWLDEAVPDDDAAARIVRTYKDAASALDARMVDKLVAGHRAKGFAGSHACASCHAEDYAVWEKSLHGVAMRTLVEKDSHRDPDCVPCHLVDLPQDERAFDPDAMGVGCEACHGASAAHAEDPSVRTPVPDGGKSTCVSQCHHPPEVKNFDFDAQWPRIRHGGK